MFDPWPGQTFDPWVSLNLSCYGIYPSQGGPQINYNPEKIIENLQNKIIKIKFIVG